MLKTEEVRQLVQQALSKVVTKDEDVTYQVARIIETDPALRAWYDQLCASLKTGVVNQSIGRWTSNVLGWPALRQVPATGLTIIKSYSKLRPQDAS